MVLYSAVVTAFSKSCTKMNIDSLLSTSKARKWLSINVFSVIKFTNRATAISQEI